MCCGSVAFLFMAYRHAILSCTVEFCYNTFNFYHIVHNRWAVDRLLHGQHIRLLAWCKSLFHCVYELYFRTSSLFCDKIYVCHRIKIWYEHGQRCTIVSSELIVLHCCVVSSFVWIFDLDRFMRPANPHSTFMTWWRHQMETFSALLALCAGNSLVTGDFPSQRPVTRSFDVFFDLRLNKRLSKQSWGWWFETPPLPLWRHCNEHCSYSTVRKYSKPYLRTLGRDPRDTLPCVHSSFDWSQ